MEQPLWLTLVEAFSAASVALFTGMLYSAQQKSNRVLARQAEIQEAQQRLQQQLADLETGPWLVLGRRSAPGAGIFELYLSNPGRAGTAVTDVLRHESRPDRPRQETGTPLQLNSLTLPLALPPGETVVLMRGNSTEIKQAAGDGWLEVRYRSFSAEAPLLSDLWRLGKGRFVLEWAGEEVEEG